MSVEKIQLGQLWRLDATGENWLVTKVYSEAFASYAMLRKAGGAEGEIRRVKVSRLAEGVGLSGFTFAQESESF